MPGPSSPPKRPRDPGRRRRPRHWWEQPIGPLSVVAIMVVVLLVGELAARSVAKELPPHRGAEQEVDVKGDQVRSHPPVQVVFAGASTVDVGFDPAQFDAASKRFDLSYNAGLKGMPVTVQPAWLRFVDRKLHPKVVVLDLQPTQLVIDRGTLAAEYQQQVASFTAWVAAAARGTGADLDRTVGRSSVLVRDRSDLRRPSLLARAALDAAQGKDAAPLIDADTRAYVVANTAADGRDLEFRDVPPQVSLDPGGARAFDTLLKEGLELGDTRTAIKAIQRQHVTLVLTILPIDVATLSKLGMSKTAYLKAVQSIRDLAHELRLPLIEFPDLTDPGLWHDKVHLADPGAAAASKELATKLDQLCASGLACS